MRAHRRLIWLNAVVSVITVAAEYVCYLLLAKLGDVNYLWAHGIASVSGILLNFGLSRAWVFADSQGHWGPQLVRYGIATALGIAGGIGLNYVLCDVVGMRYELSWCVSNLSMFLFWTYPTNHFIVFPARARATERD
jgi:putative flippase GtrA